MQPHFCPTTSYYRVRLSGMERASPVPHAHTCTHKDAHMHTPRHTHTHQLFLKGGILAQRRSKSSLSHDVIFKCSKVDLELRVWRQKVTLKDVAFSQSSSKLNKPATLYLKSINWIFQAFHTVYSFFRVCVEDACSEDEGISKSQKVME